MTTTPEAIRTFTIKVTTDAAGARADLLSLAVVLHRRQVEVLSAELEPARRGRRVFTARYAAMGPQALTVASSYQNMVDVITVALSEDLGGSAAPDLRVETARAS